MCQIRCHELESARVKRTPFEVVNVEETPDIIKSWTKQLALIYEKPLPFATRPIRELWINGKHPVLIKIRSNFNGAWETLPLKSPKEKTKKKNIQYPMPKKQAEMYDQEQDRKKMVILMRSLYDGEFPLPEPSYEGLCQYLRKSLLIFKH